MGKTQKILLVVAIVTAVLAGLIAIGVYFVKTRMLPDLHGVGVEVRKEAELFAKGRSSSECVTEALRRQSSDGTFMGGVKAKVFMKRCLQTCRPDRDFCKGVPAYGEILDTVTWTMGECARRDRANDQGCTRTMEEVIQFCSGK